MAKDLNPFRMNRMAGLNNTTFNVGKALTVTGLLVAAGGFALTVLTVGKFKRVEDYDIGHEFVDAVLG